MEMTIKQIIEACGGKLLCGNENTVITSVSTDSRKIENGALFVPIIGEKNDAHSFIPDVFAAGAAAALTQESAKPAGGTLISVSDTLGALQKIAAAYRRRFDIPFIGVTGSAGKTTTREMTALALSSEMNVMKTQGNYNSQIGLPLTMFRLSKGHQAAVAEMGMSNFGEMSRLAKIAAPNLAVVTNIGTSHIAQLKTKENILNEKLHITDYFTEDSTAFLNGDDSMLSVLRGKLPYRTVYYGTQPWCDFRAEEIKAGSESSKFKFVSPDGKTGEATLNVPGNHYVLDALAALAVAWRLGVSLDKAAAALSEYRPLAMRQQIRHINGVTVIDDSYNSSPDALISSLNVLSGFKSGRRVAVLADMLELGDFSRKAHFDAGVRTAELGIDILFTVGEQSKEIASGALSVRPGMDCRAYDGNRQAAKDLKTLLKAGDTVLIKGSRSMHTDEIVNEIIKTI